jgi:hypothetical protein
MRQSGTLSDFHAREPEDSGLNRRPATQDDIHRHAMGHPSDRASANLIARYKA